MDYSILDLRTSFTPSEAAMAWCDVTTLTSENKHEVQHILNEISEAIRIAQLPASIPVTDHYSWVKQQPHSKRHPNKAQIKREDLRRWADARGVKPKFLFPEAREIQTIATISEFVPLEKPTPISKSQQRFALYRMQAKEIWNKHPDYTQDQVANVIIEDAATKKYGAYSIKTIVRYIAEVDPRPDRVGRRSLKIIG